MNQTNRKTRSGRRGVYAALLLSLLLSCNRGRAATGEPVRRRAPAPVKDTPAGADTSPDWTVEAGDDGNVLVRYRGTVLATFKYVFWGEGYSWADARVKQLRSEAGVTTFSLEVPTLGLKIPSKVSRTGPGELTVEYTRTADRPLHGVVGGGLEWRLTLASAPTDQAPSLLPEYRGFRWPMAAGEALTVSFAPAAAEVYFERNQKSVVRSFLVGRDLAPGTSRITMTVTLPSGGRVRPSLDERYGHEDRSTWYKGALKSDQSPVDVSFLNHKPAGRHGRVHARGDDLAFEDGTPARFWGTNLMAYALFASRKEDIALQARRLAALGYNLVRIHHHDSDWVSPNIFDEASGPSQTLNPGALESLDYWIHCLKEQGIYVWMDLHVGRQFLPGQDIEGFAELARGQGAGKGFNYVNPRIETLMQELATRYLTHVNRYTGKPYTEEPALLGVLLTNENDLTFHYGNAFLPDKNHPIHARRFEGIVQDFAERSGMSKRAMLRTWEPGPSKLALNELEHRFAQRAIEKLRALNLNALVATTNFWGDEPLFCLPALASGDIVDVHAYGDAEALGTNPRAEPNFVAWIGAAQVAGKPLSITEWNVEHPKRDRFVAPLYLAAIASLQGWDAPMLYGYNQRSFAPPDRADPWSTYTDPAITGVMPAAALLFRQGHVKGANRTYRLDISRQDLYYAATSPATSATLRTLVEQSKLTIGLPDVPELDWDAGLSRRDGKAIAITDLARDFIPPGQTFVASDTGELKRDWVAGVETIDTPLSQAAFGWIGGRHLELRDVTFDIQTPKALVALTSLDGKPLATSMRMLLTVLAQVVAGEQNQLPFLSQPVRGQIAVRAPAPLRLSPQGGSVDKAAESVTRREGNLQTFTLDPRAGTHWFLLTR